MLSEWIDWNEMNKKDSENIQKPRFRTLIDLFKVKKNNQKLTWMEQQFFERYGYDAKNMPDPFSKN